jgi:hypothetical protein
MRRLAAMLLMLYSTPIVPEQLNVQWCEAGVFGACTRTDMIELGGCFKLKVRRRPRWHK